MPSLDDPAYNDQWTRLLVVLENRGIGSISTESLVKCTEILSQIRQAKQQGGFTEDEGEILDLYMMCLETVILVQTKQADLQVTELQMRLEAAGLTPLDSKRLEKP